MMIPIGRMVPGADIDFSLDLAKKIPTGEILTAGTVTMRSGAQAASATFSSIEGTKVLFRVVATAKGKATFDVVGTFSNGRDDGEQMVVFVD